MKKLSVQFTLEELQELLEMVENQLFRMKFIDSKIPGHKPNPEKQRVSNSAVNTLQEAYKKAKGFKRAHLTDARNGGARSCVAQALTADAGVKEQPSREWAGIEVGAPFISPR